MKTSLKFMLGCVLSANMLSGCGEKQTVKTPTFVEVTPQLNIKAVVLNTDDQSTLDAFIKAGKDIDAGGDPKAYMAAWVEALDFAKTLYEDPHPVLEDIQVEIATAHFMLGDITTAMKMIENSILVYEASGPEYEQKLMEMYNNMGVAYNMTGRLQDARDISAKVLAQWRVTYAGKSDYHLALGIENLAMAERSLGNYAAAIPLNEEAIQMGERIVGTSVKATDALAVSLGNSVLYLHESGTMVDPVGTIRTTTNRIIEILPEDHPRIVLILTTASIVLVEAGKLKEAEDMARRALSIRETVLGRRSTGAATPRQTLVTVLLHQKKYEEALALSELNLEILTAELGVIGQKTIVTRENRANALYGLGQKDKALQNLTNLVAEMSKDLPPENVEMLGTQETLATLLVRDGYILRAMPYLQAIQKIRRKSFGKEQRPFLATEALVALAEVRTGERDAGMARIAEILPTINTLLDSDMLGAGSKTKTGANLKKALGRMVAASVEAGDFERAFEISQKYTLGAASVAVSRAEIREAVQDPSLKTILRERQDILEARTLALSEFYQATADGNTAIASAKDKSVAQLTTQARAMTSQILKTSSGAVLARDARAYTLQDVQNRLEDKSAFLYTVETVFGVYVCIVTKDGFVMQKTSGDPSSIEARVIGIRRALNPNGTALGDLETFSQTSNALYNMLFSTQAEQALEGIDHIYVVSKGRLAALPFSVLSPSSEGQKTPKWLTQKFSFSYPAGLQHLMQKKKADKTSRPKLFIGIGDPYLQSANIEKTALGGGGISDYANLRSAGDAKVLTALPTLKFAKAELRSMSEAIQAKQTLILSGKQATEIDVMASPLEKADIIAFATHGVMAHELEGVGEAALVVSLPENTGDVSPMNDGLLTSSEIARLHLSADWVVLSACNTGTGENNGDDAFSGLASAFIYAGADNLLVSHWPVRDDAAAFLTVNTVKNTQDGLSKARALQKAMVDLMESDLPNANHPAVWAPFVLVGN